MAVGQSALFAGSSYVAVGRETTFGTYTTATAAWDVLSMGIKTQRDSKVLDQIERSRTMTKRVQLGKTVGGAVASYFYPSITATSYVLQNAFGGAVTTATTTGETAGGAGRDHTFVTGDLSGSYPSLCLNVRKGPATTGKVFQYSGVRVNSLAISAALDDAIKMTTEFIGVDSTTLSNDVESALTVSSLNIMSFVDARFSVETAFASLTSTSFWHVMSADFKLMNNLKSDNSARRIGSDVLSVLPIGVQSYELQCQVRYDTTTAHAAMLAGTQYSAELVFQGLATMTSSVAKEQLKLQFPKLFVKDAGDPEIAGPDEVLQSTVTFQVLRDDTTSTGYACRAVLTNNISTLT